MRKFLKRGFAALLSLAMIVSIAPQFGRAEKASAAENDGTESVTHTAEKVTLKNGTYVIPFTLDYAYKNTSDNTYTWKTNSMYSGLKFSLSRYLTVTVKDGTYDVELEAWNTEGNGITGVQTVNDPDLAYDAKAVCNAKLDADALKGVADDDIIDTILSKGYAATGSAVEANEALTEEPADSNLMTKYTYRTDDLRDVIVLVDYVNSSWSYYRSLENVRLTLDTDHAVSTGSGNKYSVISMNVGNATNSVDSTMSYVGRAVFDKSADVEKTSDGYKATFDFSEIEAGSYDVDGLYLVEGSDDTHLPYGNDPEKYPENFKKVEIKDGKVSVDFKDLNSSIYVRLNDTASSYNYLVCRIRFIRGDIYKNSLADSSNSITLKSGSSIDNLSLSVQKSDESDPPEWMENLNVSQVMTQASKGKYEVYKLSLKDKNGDPASVENAIATVTLPEGADASDYKVYQYVNQSGTQGLTQYYLASYAKDGSLYIDGDLEDGMTLVVFKNTELQDVRDLDDGCYKVRVTLWNATQKAQSMAATVVEPDAYLAVKNDRYYLQFNVRMSTVMGLPAFMTRCYALNLKADESDYVAYYKPASTVAVHADADVKSFALSRLAETYKSYGIAKTEEQAKAQAEEVYNSDEGYLKNNLHYLKTLSLDVTNSILKSGLNKHKIAIAFASDTMDGLYSGIPGSDNGLNEAALMVGDAEKTDEVTIDQIRGKDKLVDSDKSELQKYFNRMLTITPSRSRHDKQKDYDSLVPAWSSGYLAYTSVASTQGAVDRATEALREALDKNVDLTKYKEITGKGVTKRYAEESSYATYSAVKAEAADTVNKDDVTQEEADKAAADLEAAYEAVMPSESYRERTQKLIDSSEERDTSNYTTESVDDFKEAIKNAKDALADESTTYAELDAAYTALNRIQLYTKAEDGADSELSKLVEKAEKIDTEPYTNDSREAFETALKDAQDVVGKKDKSSDEINNAKSALEDAIESLIVFEDGTYNVPVSLYKSNDDSVSMGNAALVQTAKLKAKDGKYTLTFRFKKMTFSGREGYLMTLGTLSNIKYNSANVPETYDVEPAEVLSTYDVTDTYNSEDSSDEICAGKKYPKDLRISVDGISEYVPAEVYVPVMGSMGIGNQLCRLKIDYSKAVKYNAGDIENEEDLENANKAVKSALAAANAVKAELYTEDTYKALQAAVTDAEAVQADSAATADQLNDAADKVNSARKALKKIVDPADLKDGVYTVDFTMVNAADTTKNSMSDNAVEKPMKIVVKDGKYTAYVNFKGMDINFGGEKLTGYLKKLYYYDGKDYKETTVESTYDVVDAYNDADGDGNSEFNYPEKLSFPLVNKDKGDDENGYIKAQVFVPVMEAINEGSGTQNVLIKIDWNSIKISEEQPETTVPATTPAVTEAPETTVPATSPAIKESEEPVSTESAAPEATETAAPEATGTAAPEATETAAPEATETAAPQTAATTAPKDSTAATNTAVSTKSGATVVKGKTYKVSGSEYKVTKAADGSEEGEVTYVKAPNKKKVKVPATVRLADGKTYKVTAIAKGAFSGDKIRTVTVGKNIKKIEKKAFKGSKVKKLVIKTRKLTKKDVKNALKGSKIKKIKVKVGSKKENKKYIKKYKKIFKKSNSGKKVKVK